jgi:sugar lactone lactonase YvrE
VGPMEFANGRSFKILPILALLHTGMVCLQAAQPYSFSVVAGDIGHAPGNADGTNYNARFNQPAAIVKDSNGTFFVSDLANNKIRTISRQGSDWIVRTIAGSGAASRVDGTNLGATFSQPQGLALDATGNVFVADSLNNAVRKLTLVGTNWVTRTIGIGFSYPNALAVDGAGNIYVANNSAHTIALMTPVGTNYVVSTIAGAPNNPGSADGTNGNARFHSPNGIAVDGSGNIYVADYGNYTIRQISQSGTDWVVQTIAGAAGHTGTVDGTNDGARFAIPLGVTVDPAGDLWISQASAIRKVTHIGTNWVVATVAGPSTQFFMPNSLMIDEAANLYVTDTSHNVIQFGQPLFKLQSALVQNNLVLSWPALASNYFLEWTSDLVNPAWSPTTNTISTSGASFVVTNEISSPAAFYRLRKP